MKFGHKHYVPILKTKGGERWALSYLDKESRNQITPLLEFHLHKTKALASHIEEVCESLEAAWGNEREVFLDTHWLHHGKKSDAESKELGDPAAIRAALTCARSYLRGIPVIRLAFRKTSRKEIRDAIENDGRAVMLRVRPRDLTKRQEFDSLLSDLGLEPQDVHLLMDYRKSPMTLTDDVPQIPHLKYWATLTAASGVFPQTLKEYDLGKWHKIPRNDWISWSTDIADNELKRIPAFADYTTRDTGAPVDGGSPSVNLRYARAESWLVRVGGKVKEGKSPEMKQVCKSLIGMTKEFDGPDFSAGDKEIYKTAQPEGGPGNAGQWVQWGVSHHMVLTANAIVATHA